MGTCEEMGVTQETQIEVNLGNSSNGAHKDDDGGDHGHCYGDDHQYHDDHDDGENHDHDDDELTEEEVLAQQFERVVLEGNGCEVEIERQIEEEEEQQGENGEEQKLQIYPLRSYAEDGYQQQEQEGENGEEQKLQNYPLRPYAGDGYQQQEQEGENGEEEKLQFYPLRPYAVDCSFYLKTGTCKYGENCRFNHPSERAFQPVQEQVGRTTEDNGTMVDPGKIDCKYFQTPGGCKYGDACRYNHSAKRVEKEAPELNFLGLPLRPSEQECTFYLRNGSCGYGANCRYHHPDPTATKETEPRNSLTNGIYVRGGDNFSQMHAAEPLQSSGAPRGISKLSNGVNSMNGLPYGGMNSYHQTMPQNGGWNQDQVNLPLTAKKAPLPHQIFNFSTKADPSTRYEQVMQSDEFPVRPGQPDCDYFVKTGDCKYRAACRYNHPVTRAPKLRLPPLGSKGPYSKSRNLELSNSNPGNARRNGMPSHPQQQMQNGQYPERPGQAECEYFMKTGSCKFKAACKFHHPRDRISTSSAFALNNSGLPLRPGSKICRNYELQGTCKFGRNCLFHHPDEGTKASAVVPVAPVAVDDHSSSNVVACEYEAPADSNVDSDWGDGWVM